MILKGLLNQGSLKHHSTSKEEVEGLFKLARRDIKDSKSNSISIDRRFAAAYNAVLQLATILIYCRGYIPAGWGHHFTVFKAMKTIMGKEYEGLSDYFDSCRAKRNITDYRHAGEISESETNELITEAEKFFGVTLKFVKKNHPTLL